MNYPPLFARRFCRVSPRPNALLCTQEIPKTHRRCACVRVRVRLPYLMYCDSSHAIQGNVGQMRGCFLYANTLALKTVKVFHAVCRMQSRRVCPLPYLARIKRQPATRASRHNAIPFPCLTEQRAQGVVRRVRQHLKPLAFAPKRCVNYLYHLPDAEPPCLSPFPIRQNLATASHTRKPTQCHTVPMPARTARTGRCEASATAFETLPAKIRRP